MLPNSSFVVSAQRFISSFADFHFFAFKGFPSLHDFRSVLLDTRFLWFKSNKCDKRPPKRVSTLNIKASIRTDRQNEVRTIQRYLRRSATDASHGLNPRNETRLQDLGHAWVRLFHRESTVQMIQRMLRAASIRFISSVMMSWQMAWNIMPYTLYDGAQASFFWGLVVAVPTFALAYTSLAELTAM